MTATATRPVILTPTGDPTPVEKAAVDGILDGFGPETFLTVVFNRPDGGARVWYAWTAGGQPLGNDVDHRALAAGMDAADWFHIADRHCEHTERGRIAIQAYPLRPVLADVQTGVRGPECWRDALRREITTLRWLGFGPALVGGA